MGLKISKIETNQFHAGAEVILQDYRLAYRSRQASLVGRREVISGKAKFGIFGDGKEIVQIAMAKVFQPGDFRSGYYRDQTFMFAIGQLTLQQFFAQLYAHTDLEAEPATGGRLMVAHFATRSLDADGSWKDLTQIPNSSADVSPTAAQMPRLVGLAAASLLYRELDGLKNQTMFSSDGNEVAFGTIGNAATSEGIFWEAVNAIGVLQVPAVITIYDDEYGISVPNELQMVKGDLSEILKGFQRTEEFDCRGFDIYTVAGWDYASLIDTYAQAASRAREEHVPAIIHAIQLTQPLGHSTSGSQERYKSKERLDWEKEHDAIKIMREWVLSDGIVTETELAEIEREERSAVETSREAAFKAFQSPILDKRRQMLEMLASVPGSDGIRTRLELIIQKLTALPTPLLRDLDAASLEALVQLRHEPEAVRQPIIEWRKRIHLQANAQISSHLQDESARSALQVQAVQPVYAKDTVEVMGFELLNEAFEAAFERDPRLVAFGEDIGRLGDVNQGFRGLQAKFGDLRITDTGIREATIIGQAIGMAMRGLRPIAEIQYLDYILYGLQVLSDDLATLHWRTRGGQRAPVIIRTRGHRLEGVWHSGSPMAGIINLVRGIHVLVPRNMTQAAGFYNTLLRAEEPAIVIEVLNGYRIREKVPTNLGEFTVPLGIPEVLRTGGDATLVTYGASCSVALAAAAMLQDVGISIEVIDAQCLLPFDRENRIVELVKKTSRLVLVDEDVPGGTTAYMLQHVLEHQGGFQWLDSAPVTISGKAHRPAYGSDGDHWSKPNPQNIFEAVYFLMSENDPTRYPPFFRAG